jgi:alkylation response protein AidB-like acyl-CoA dehydrogenase
MTEVCCPITRLLQSTYIPKRPGGSDVSQVETNAMPTEKTGPFGPQYVLNGFKWFSSATDGDVAVALARTGSLSQGSRGLSLFLIPLRRPLLRDPSTPVPSPTSNNIFIHRLKNKIGTHTLPTAELSLENSEAYLIGDLNHGVKNISPVLNITRIWSAMASIGCLRKCLAIATAYAKVRKVHRGSIFLKDAPLHVSQLASINLLYRALTHLTFGVIRLLGKSECGVATPDELRRLRVLTLVAKAFAAEKACGGMEESMSAMGGAGYMEENDFGRLIRDSLVEKCLQSCPLIGSSPDLTHSLLQNLGRHDDCLGVRSRQISPRLYHLECLCLCAWQVFILKKEG